MGHIRYSTLTFDLPDSDFEKTRELVINTLQKDDCVALTVTDRQGDTSCLLISRGVHVSFHSWDAPNFG